MTKKKTTKIDDKVNEANIYQPRSLKRVDELKRKLTGNNDHLSEVVEWEKRAKTALLKIDLAEHQGVRLFLAGIIQLIKETNELLQIAKSDELSDSQRNGLIDKKDFMIWILEFFKEARTDLKSIEEELEFQLDGEVESDTDEEELLEMDSEDQRGKL